MPSALANSRCLACPPALTESNTCHVVSDPPCATITLSKARVTAFAVAASSRPMGSASGGPGRPDHRTVLRTVSGHRRSAAGGWRARRALPDWREHVDEPVSISHTERNGPLYPFSLAEKLERITERHEWYMPEGVASSPWRRDPADPRAEGSASDEAHD